MTADELANEIDLHQSFFKVRAEIASVIREARLEGARAALRWGYSLAGDVQVHDILAMPLDERVEKYAAEIVARLEEK